LTEDVVKRLEAQAKADDKEIFEKSFALENAEAKCVSLEEGTERLRKMLGMLRKDNQQLTEKGWRWGQSLS